jgi:hypothetical protein
MSPTNVAEIHIWWSSAPGPEERKEMQSRRHDDDDDGITINTPSLETYERAVRNTRAKLPASPYDVDADEQIRAASRSYSPNQSRRVVIRLDRNTEHIIPSRFADRDHEGFGHTHTPHAYKHAAVQCPAARRPGTHADRLAARVVEEELRRVTNAADDDEDDEW